MADGGRDAPVAAHRLAGARPLAAVVAPVAGCLALLLAALGPPALTAVAVALLQVPLALAWLAVAGVTGTGGGVVLVLAAAAGADVATLAVPGDGAAALGPVVGLGLGAAFLQQLLRGPGRVGVTDSLSAVLSGVVLAASAACWVAVRGTAGGREVVVIAATALGVTLLAGRGLTAALPTGRQAARQPAAGSGEAALAGARVAAALAGATAGVGAGAVVGGAYGAVGTGYGALVAVAVALVALTADLAVDVVSAGLPHDAYRAAGAVVPVATVLPLVAAAPAAYLVGRVLLG